MVARVIAFIRSNAWRQPTLNEISGSLGLSAFHLQRIFSEWAGVSPKRFLQYVTKEHVKQALRSSGDLLSVTLEAGLSSPGRLHDLMVTCEAMSPGEIKALGAGLEIRFGEAPTPFGNALIAWTARGICHLGFVEGDATAHAVACLQQDWPAAALVQDRQRALQLAAEIFHAGPSTQALHLMLRGTFRSRCGRPCYLWRRARLCPTPNSRKGRVCPKLAAASLRPLAKTTSPCSFPVIASSAQAGKSAAIAGDRTEKPRYSRGRRHRPQNRALQYGPYRRR